MRKLIQQPYEGPFRMISRHAKSFNVDVLGRIDTVSIGHLQVAYVDDSILPDNSRFGVNPTLPSDDTSVSHQGP